MNRFKLLLVVQFLFIWQLSQSQSSETLPENVVKSIEKRIENEINPSIAIGIVDEKGVRYYSFGKVSVEGEKVNEHTIYEIGSVSKVFTAILLAQQVTEGAVALDDPISQHLPKDVNVPVMGSKEITLGNLSDHTSGLPRLPQNFMPTNPDNPYADYSVDQLYSSISTYEPTRKVGAEYEYSNLAQGLLGHLLALNEGVSYEELMIENIASPLGMGETKIVLDQAMRDNLAIGHNQGAETDNWDIPTLAGAGAIRSSTADMLKFLSANLGISESPIQPAMELTHQVRHSKASGMSVGLGWHFKKGKSGDVLWHNGGTGGYRAFAGFVREIGKGVVVLTNSSISVDDIGFHLLDPGSKLTAVKPKADAIQIPEETLEKYVGTYELAPAFRIAITREGSRLFEQATGQGRLELFAKNETEFYLAAVDAQVTFQIAEGTVQSLTLFQGGQETVGKRISDGSDMPKAMTEANAVQVSEEILDRYVGSYQLSPAFSITITREGSQLFEQATGQGRLELFAKNETEFYLTAVEAQVTFQIVEGEVQSLTLVQAGREMVGEKIND